MLIKLFCLFTFLSTFDLHAQKIDTTLSQKVNFNFEYGNYYATRLNSAAVGNDLHLPKTISNVRSLSYNGYNPEKSLDNPLRHLGFYIDLIGQVQVTDSSIFQVNIVAEHRGVSYGVYDVKNMALIPQFVFKLNENLSLFKK
ncbi:MAG: hypothetical protein AB8B74_14530 [Crocinitomicaceae bacterium]